MMPLFHDGTVNYETVLHEVHAQTNSKAMKAFLVASAWQGNEAVDGAADTTGWRFAGDDPSSARERLSNLLEFNACLISDVFRTIDSDGDAFLTQQEFVNAFTETLGFAGLPVVVYQVLASACYHSTPRPHPRERLTINERVALFAPVALLHLVSNALVIPPVEARGATIPHAHKR